MDAELCNYDGSVVDLLRAEILCIKTTPRLTIRLRKILNKNPEQLKFYPAAGF